MCKIYGYCRVSTKEQNLERQERTILAAFPEAIVRKEKYTGTKLEGRAELEKLLKVVKPGDTIVFDNVDRMSRNADLGWQLYTALFNQGVNLVFLKQPYINTEVYASRIRQADIATGKTYIDEGLKTILLGIAQEQIRIAFDQAQQEVDDKRKYIKEGIKEKKLRNELIDAGIIQGEKTQIGQQPGRKLNVKKAAAAKEIIRKHSVDFGGTLRDPECIKLAGCSRNSFYKYKREIIAENQH